MSKTINLALAAAFAVSAAWTVPAMARPALVTGDPCLTGTTNCVADDSDDPSKGHYVNPSDPVTTTKTDSDTGVVTTSPPTPPPTPAPPPAAD